MVLNSYLSAWTSYVAAMDSPQMAECLSAEGKYFLIWWKSYSDPKL